MFRNKDRFPTGKPDPPTFSQICLALMVIICAVGFTSSLSEFRSINDKLRYEEQNQEYVLPEIAVPERRR